MSKYQDSFYSTATLKLYQHFRSAELKPLIFISSGYHRAPFSINTQPGAFGTLSGDEHISMFKSTVIVLTDLQYFSWVCPLEEATLLRNCVTLLVFLHPLPSFLIMHLFRNTRSLNTHRRLHDEPDKADTVQSRGA